MPCFLFQWTEEIERHLAEHDVTPAEFEQAISGCIHIEKSRPSGNLIAFGKTAAGRELACVFALEDDVLVLPVTAWENER